MSFEHKLTGEVKKPTRPNIPNHFIDPGGVRTKDMVLPGIMPGVPHRGAIPHLKDNDPRQPQVAIEYFATTLDMSQPDDIEYYMRICTAVANQFAVLRCEERHYDEAIKSWRIFMVWAFKYTYMTEGSHNG